MSNKEGEPVKHLSMEEFGPISVDYFNGRRVEEVIAEPNQGADALGTPAWTIQFEGGGYLHNYDPSVPVPNAIKGAGLTMVILGAHEGEGEQYHAVTELRFGLESVKLNPMEYAVNDPAYTKGDVVYPQRSKADMPPELQQPSEDEDDGA